MGFIKSISKGVHVGVGEAVKSVEGSPEEEERRQDWDLGTENSYVYVEASWRPATVTCMWRTSLELSFFHLKKLQVGLHLDFFFIACYTATDSQHGALLLMITIVHYTCLQIMTFSLELKVYGRLPL